MPALAIVAILAAFAPSPAVQDEPPVAGRFDDKVVYGVASEGVDVERLRRHCRDLGGRFDECGSPCAPGAICASVCAFTCEQVPASPTSGRDLERGPWLRYVSEEEGFELEHPSGAKTVKLDDGAAGVRFVYERGPVTEGAAPELSDGFALTVKREELPPGRSLEEFAREEAGCANGGSVEPVELGTLDGFAFEGGAPPVRTTLLAAPGGPSARQYWRVRQAYRDPAGIGYERVLGRMLASFAAIGPG